MAGESVGGKAALQVRLAMFSIARGQRGARLPVLPADRQLPPKPSLLKIGAEAPIEWSNGARNEVNEAEGAEPMPSICLLQLLQTDPIQSTPAHLHV